MKAVEIKGIIPPIITPMNEDESINVAELRAQVNRQIEGGVHAIFCFGTNGEGYILNGKEKELVLRPSSRNATAACPSMPAPAASPPGETIEQSKMAQSLGADVLSIITPSFAAASQNELYEHYKAVAEAVDMPIVLYNIPARTGNALAPATVARLAQIDNIVGRQGFLRKLHQHPGIHRRREHQKERQVLHPVRQRPADHLEPCWPAAPAALRAAANVYPQHHGVHL